MLGNKRVRKNRYKREKEKKKAEFIYICKLCVNIFSKAFAICLLSCIFILAYDFMIQCNYFKADTIDVKNANRLSERQILAQAGIKRGYNILAINIAEARANLLAHPWISYAEVRRDFPDGFTIKIKEHDPLALIDLFGEKYLINNEGQIIKKSDASDPHDLPIVTGLDFSDVNNGGKRKNNAFASVMNILKLGQISGSIIPTRLIKRIHVDREIGLTVYRIGKIKTIKLGYKRFLDKYERLKEILFYFQNQGLLKEEGYFSEIEFIDLKDIDKVVVKPIHCELSALSREEI